MSNEIKTHRLIVTLPDVSGEESDVIAGIVEDYLAAGHSEINGTIAATVTHALGESLPRDIQLWKTGELNPETSFYPLIILQLNKSGAPTFLNALEARQLAGVLLARADEIEGLA